MTGDPLGSSEPPRKVRADHGWLLTSAVRDDHEKIRGMLGAALGAIDDPAHPRRSHALGDTFLATLSRHLAVAEDLLYPAAKVAPRGRSLAAAQVRSARELERAMRRVEGSLYGDRYALATPRAQLWRELAGLFEAHARNEERFTPGLDRGLPAPRQHSLARAFELAADAAPTRPHPYSPHSGLAGRLIHRIWSLADRVMDAMDSRIIPHKNVPRGARDGRWAQYLLGRAGFASPPDGAGSDNFDQLPVPRDDLLRGSIHPQQTRGKVNVKEG